MRVLNDFYGRQHRKNCDEVLAKERCRLRQCVGAGEPNPALDATLTLGGHPVAVPQGDPVNLLDFTSFTQSEYLLYQESQAS